jgi:biotin synthase
MKLDLIIEKGRDGKGLNREESLALMKGVRPGSKEMFIAMQAADELSKTRFKGIGEIAAQIGLNWGPCENNCTFCVFGEKHGIARTPTELTTEEIVNWAQTYEKEGANAISLMATANFPFDRYLDIGRIVRNSLKTDISLAANIGDLDEAGAKALVDAGFTAAYHARRLREGVDTKLDPEKRLNTIRCLKDAGLIISSCVEPIGPEHTSEELVDSIIECRNIGVESMATMRRISVPGTPLFNNGMIPETELARITSIARLIFGDKAINFGVHEPNVLALVSGANIVFPEVGPNPRDMKLDTSKGRGRSVAICKQMLWEAGWKPFFGPLKNME